MSEPDREKIDARVGTTLAGKYHLLRVLGVGGMGAVYEAENTWTERRVAIKLMLSELTKNKDVASRFLREARSASKISHPNIVDVLDMGEDPVDGSLFIVQEFLSGADLRHLLDRRKMLSPEHALEIITPIASALIAAHRRGVIHRDLKPENIFLMQGPSGGIVPKLIDFGIAKMNADARDATSLTRTGSAMGTAQYMSPEQARGDREIDGQTDVWALGVVLFETLSGRCPFDGDSYNAILAQILMSPVPRLDSFAPSVPRSLADVVARALERDRANRYRSMQAFLGALLECAPLRSEQWHQNLRITHGGAAQENSGAVQLLPDDSSVPTPEFIPAAKLISEFAEDDRTSVMGGDRLVHAVEALRAEAAARPATGSTPESAPRVPPTTFGRSAKQITAPKPERQALVALVLGGFVLLVVSVGLAVNRGRDPAVAATTRTTSPRVVPVTTFDAIFDIEPAVATIEIDGVPAGSGHVARTLPIDGRTHAARFSAPGYTERRMFFTDSLAATRIVLDPIAAPVPAVRPTTPTRRAPLGAVVSARPAPIARPAVTPMPSAAPRPTATPRPTGRNGAAVLGLD